LFSGAIPIQQQGEIGEGRGRERDGMGKGRGEDEQGGDKLKEVKKGEK